MRSKRGCGARDEHAPRSAEMQCVGWSVLPAAPAAASTTTTAALALLALLALMPLPFIHPFD